MSPERERPKPEEGGAPRSWPLLRASWRRVLPLLLFLGGMVWLSYRALETSRVSSIQRRNMRRVFQETESVVSDLKDAETGQRGYLLTGDPAYLEPYIQGQRRYRQHMTDLEAALKAQPLPGADPHLSALKALAEAKLSELRMTVQLASGGDRDAALRVVRTGEGKDAMDRIRQEVAGITGLGTATVDRITSASDRAAGWAETTVLVLGLVAATGILLSELSRARSTAELVQAERRYHRLTEVTQEGLVLIRDGLILDVNRAYCEMFGYTAEELVGRPVLDLVDPEWTRGVKARHHHHIEGSYEASVVRKDGTRFMVYATSREMVDDEGRRLRVSAVKDLTLERARSAERQRLLDILDATPDFIAVYDARMRPVHWNRALRELHELHPGAPLDPDLEAGRVHPDPTLDLLRTEAFPAALEKGSWVGETAFLDAAGREIPTSQLVLALKDEEGTVTHFACLARDIREQKRLEALKREFVAMSNHELRTPLTALIGSLRLLQAGVGGEQPEGARELLQVAAANGDRLLRLLNDLLDLDRLETGAMPLSPRALELDGVLAAAVDLHQEYARPFGVAIRLGEGHAKGLRASGDEHRVMQVLGNLLSNAAKFSPEGAVVTLEARPEGRMVRISVRDRGLGIPAAFRDRIFKKFEQEEGTRAHRPGGTGLGLAVAKLLVERMGGTIGFETAEGAGTTFSFTLPAEAPVPAPPA